MNDYGSQVITAVIFVWRPCIHSGKIVYHRLFAGQMALGDYIINNVKIEWVFVAKKRKLERVFSCFVDLPCVVRRRRVW